MTANEIDAGFLEALREIPRPDGLLISEQRPIERVAHARNARLSACRHPARLQERISQATGAWPIRASEQRHWQQTSEIPARFFGLEGAS